MPGFSLPATYYDPPEPDPIPDAWESRDRSTDVPDLTPGGGCLQLWRSWICTRRAGHTGRHAAGAITNVAAVWRNPDDVPGQALAVDAPIDLVPAEPPC